MAITFPTTTDEQIQFVLSNMGLLNSVNADRAKRLFGDIRDINEAAGTDTESVRLSTFSTNFRRMKEDYLSLADDVMKKVENEMANIANLRDIPSDIDEEEKQRLLEAADERETALEPWLQQAADLQLDIPEPVQLDNGNFVPAGEALDVASQNVGRTGDVLSIVDNGDGTYDLVGANGTVYETGITGIDNALSRQTELQSGATPGRTATAEPTYQTGIDPATGLPYNLDYSQFDAEQIAYLEKVADLATSNPDLLSKALGDFAITDDDINSFLEKASQEVAPYYDQIFTRGMEDYSNALRVRTEARARELEQEQLTRAQQLRDTRASFEAAGLTFSGEAVRTLGTESAYTTESLGTDVPIGELPQQQGLLASSSLAQFEEDIRSTGRSYEDVYGAGALMGAETPSLSGEAVFTPTEGVRGSLEREKETNIQTRADELAAAEAVNRAIPLMDLSGGSVEDLSNLI